MRVHFFHRHIWDNIIIWEEGNLPHSQCPRCNMMVPLRDLNRRHLATTKCAKGGESNQRRLAEEDLQESSERMFQAYGEPLETVTYFKYLGRVLTAGGDDWPAVEVSLRKARNSWVQMRRKLIREGAEPKVLRHFFKAVVQAVLLFGEEMWVLTPRMERDLSIFQYRVV